MATIEKEYLGLAAEYAVASELCRRSIYAQLTLGTRKRTDLLVETDTRMLRIQVKAKQGNSWPNCRGIYGENTALVLVDYEGKEELEKPDFYVLTVEDWIDLVRRECGHGIATGDIVIDAENIPVWLKQVKNGKPYKGMGVSASQVGAHKEYWDKLEAMVGER